MNRDRAAKTKMNGRLSIEVKKGIFKECERYKQKCDAKEKKDGEVMAIHNVKGFKTPGYKTNALPGRLHPAAACLDIIQPCGGDSLS